MTPPAPSEPPPASGGPHPRTWKVFAIPAILALMGYLVLYQLDAHWRVRKGPWEVTFERDPDGTPALQVEQPKLGITGVRVRFAGEQLGSNTPPLPAVVRFDTPQKPVPFGTAAFDDLMYLPGTLVLHCFGHEVQMLPRQLYLDRQPRGWTNGTIHQLEPGTKPSALQPPPRTSRLRR